MNQPSSANAMGASLASLMQALGSAVATTVVVPGDDEVPIRSATLLEGSDLQDGPGPGSAAVGDLCLVLAATEAELVGWVASLASAPVGRRPRAVATKITTPELERVAQHSGVALVRIHPQARLDLVLSTVRSVVDGAAQPGPDGRDDEPFGGENDLYGLAQTVAALTGGLVSIEDERSQLLAYSATDGAADELRMLSILGREGPADYLRRLREWGVYDRLRRESGAVDVPADAELGWRRRLAVDIRPLSPTDRPDDRPDGGGRRRLQPGPSLGTIWLQEGREPLDPDAGAVLAGAAAIAARLIERQRSAPTQEALQIQRLLGLRGGSVDVPSLAASLGLPTTGPAAVIGIGPWDSGEHAWPTATMITEVAAAVRLHASAYARESLVAATEHRIYVIIPRLRAGGPTAWLSSTLDRLARRTGLELRAAVAAPVASLIEIGAARAEVDRVLDRSATERIATLAESRTSVLLGEIADLLAAHDELADPRLHKLVEDDAGRDGALLSSVEHYLERFGDVRTAAAALHVHPNTLRYRIRRAEQVLGMHLDDHQDRLLLQLQILRWRRRLVDAPKGR